MLHFHLTQELHGVTGALRVRLSRLDHHGPKICPKEPCIPAAGAAAFPDPLEHQEQLPGFEVLPLILALAPDKLDQGRLRRCVILTAASHISIDDFFFSAASTKCQVQNWKKGRYQYKWAILTPGWWRRRAITPSCGLRITVSIFMLSITSKGWSF